MSKVHVEVTLEDIAGGLHHLSHPHSGDYCPVERAVSRAVGRPVRVGISGFDYGDDDIPLPFDATDWIIAFDRDGHGEPFGFDIELPD